MCIRDRCGRVRVRQIRAEQAAAKVARARYAEGLHTGTAHQGLLAHRVDERGLRGDQRGAGTLGQRVQLVVKRFGVVFLR